MATAAIVTGYSVTASDPHGPFPNDVSSQEELGHAFAQTPQDARIYIEPGVFEPNHYPFTFYADRPVGNLSGEYNLGDSEVRYAIVSESTLQQKDVEHQILLEREGIIAIKLDRESTS